MAGAWALVGALGMSLLVILATTVDHDPVVDAVSVPSATADRIILNPTADPATSQTITWRTDHTVTNGVVEVRNGDDVERIHSTTDDPFTAESGTEGEYASRSHAATLTDLSPDTSYEYRIGDGDQHWSPWYEFTTGTDTDAAFQFLYMSDTQNDSNLSGVPAMRQAFKKSPDAELVLFAGDLTDDPDNDDEWAEWFAADPNVFASINHLATAGNHEYVGEELHPAWHQSFTFPANGPEAHPADPETCEDLYQTYVSELMDNTVYFTDYQGVRFIVLDANAEDVSELTPSDEELAAADCEDEDPDLTDTWLNAQTEWLRDVAGGAPGEWVVVMHHQPIFSAAGGRENQSVRDAWLEPIKEAGIDLVLAGHDHTYSRGHLTDDEIDADTGLYSGPTFVVSVTGPKKYDLADPSQWEDWGANQVTAHEDAQLYHRLNVDGSSLSYEALEVGTGDVLDSLFLSSDDTGDKYGADSAADLPENCGGQ